MKKWLSEFQAFISKGNVLDLAVAVIIGAAFTAIVNSMVKDIINPLVGWLVGKPDFTDLFIVLQEPAGYAGPHTYEALSKAGATVFGYGAFLTAVIHFLLLAFVIFWMIKVVTLARTKLEARLKAEEIAKEEAAKAAAAAKAAEPLALAPEPEDLVLLREIRDLLKAQAQKK